MPCTVEVEKIAEQLMKDHGLTDWSFRWDNAKVRFGYCSYRKKTISLSWRLVTINSLEESIDTIKHEIAHALAGHKAGHGSLWKMHARAIGCSATRCHSANVAAPNYIAICPNCDKKHPAFRLRKRSTACGDCCKKYNNGGYDSRFRLNFQRVK